MTTILYGIPNCDTVKKARVWLDQQGVDYAFHDYKKQSVERVMLERWIAAHGWETVLNRAGTTFRKLPDEARQGLHADRAIALMLEQPSMIKRPVLERARSDKGGGESLVGFKPEAYAAFTSS